MYNSIRFDSRLYDSESVIPESRVSWLPFNTQVRQTIPFKVTKTELDLQDLDIDLDDFTEYTDISPFKLEKQPAQSYEFDDGVQLDVFIEMNFDKKFIKRNIYNYIDLLSDVGGLQSILVSWAAIFLFAFNFNDLENYMVRRLFRV